MCDKHPWSQFEDESLTTIINERQGPMHWVQIEKALKQRFGIKNRSSKQCRERWYNNLDPNCRKKDWTDEEDLIIFAYQQENGNNWSKISKVLIGRSANTIKNHFYATIRRKVRRYNKFNRDKIKKPLKDIVNDKSLISQLLLVPEKDKQDFEKRGPKRSESQEKCEVECIEDLDFLVEDTHFDSDTTVSPTNSDLSKLDCKIFFQHASSIILKEDNVEMAGFPTYTYTNSFEFHEC